MTARNLRWETMDKSSVPLSRIADLYLTTCQIEGKTDKTLRGYREKLFRFVRWLDGNLADFTLEAVRFYLQELRATQKYTGHRFTPQKDQPLSQQSIINHIRVLKGFATWLEEEGYTPQNALRRLTVPKGQKKLLSTLTALEITSLLNKLNSRTHTGCRDLAIVLLFLDTGLRCAELLSLMVADVHLDAQWLKVMGKGGKERIIPFGTRTSKALQRYLAHFRPEPLDKDFLFLTVDGRPISENAIKLIFARLAQRSGVNRLHVHLLRHTFATNYLIAGGDPLSLQQILGHSTLEMTRRYVNQAAVQEMVRQRKLSPADRLLAGTVAR